MTLAGFIPSFIVLPITLALSFIFWGRVLFSLKLSLRNMEGGRSLAVVCSALSLRFVVCLLVGGGI